jgi:hypothetical protein
MQKGAEERRVQQVYESVYRPQTSLSHKSLDSQVVMKATVGHILQILNIRKGKESINLGTHAKLHCPA